MEFKVVGQKINTPEEGLTSLQPRVRIALGGSRSFDGNVQEIDINEDEVVALHFADETAWFLAPEDLASIFAEEQRAGSNDGSIVITQRINTGSTERGFGDLLIKVLEIFTAPASEFTAAWAANNLENEIVPEEGLYQLNKDFNLIPYKANEIAATVHGGISPVLLLIHGTSSNTQGSFGHLKDSHLWSSLWQKYDGQVIAFEHRTLSKSPIENLLDILPLLPDGAPLHLLTHSRGGLIGDLLARCAAGTAAFGEDEIAIFENTTSSAEIKRLQKANALAGKKKIIVEKYLRVACPSQGTQLMTERLDLFLNILFNLLLKATGGVAIFPLGALNNLLLAVVKERANAEILPGLAAMKPDTPFQRFLNSPRELLESELNVIAGDAGKGKWKQTLAFFIARLLFWQDNDFVVDTEAMYSGFRRRGTTYYQLFAGGDVHHFAYFRNPASQQAVLAALIADPGTPPKGFTKVGVAQDDVVRGTLFPNGEILPKTLDKEKSLVVLVPGFMGSNLALEEQKIWINYGKMIAGDLMHLSVTNNNNISAPSLVSTPYQLLVSYLEKANYEVLVAPYDWRLSTHDAGIKLAETLMDIEKDHQKSIQIIAHSMGGLVVREMLMLDKKKYPIGAKLQQRPNFRVILLGTPWRGTYVVPQTLVGQGKTIRTLGRLSFREGKKNLLKVMSKYPGLYELLPLEGHAFGEEKLWDSFWKITNQNDWVQPSAEERNIYLAHKKRLEQELPALDLSKFIYIAGQDKKTVNNLVISNTKRSNSYFDTTVTNTFSDYIEKNKEKTEYKLCLEFTLTKEGDGTVTWELGIPQRLLEEKEGNRVYYQPTVHGELANDETYFPALVELLQTGRTSDLMPFKLAKAQALTRAFGRKEIEIDRPTPLADTEAGMIAELMGMQPAKRYESGKQQVEDIKVSIITGHLKYATYPILVGHFQEDGIISAEHIIDELLDKELTKRYRLGVYPGPEKTNLVLLPDEERVIGTIVVGLGSPENLSSLNLTQTIHHACLEYALQWAEGQKGSKRILGITSLLVGSGYGNLSISASINAILEGVSLTNRKIGEIRREAEQLENNNSNPYFNRNNWELPFIQEVEFVEIYRDKALQAFYVLDQIERENNAYSIRFERKLNEVQGSRDILPLAEEKDWWMRLAVRYEEDCGGGFNYTASTGRARVSKRNSAIDQGVIQRLLDANDYKKTWNRSLSKTLFELLVPNDFKMAFRNQKNILLVLDEKTAAYPWELLHYDDDSGDPLCVRTGFIRQLSTNNDAPIMKPIHQRRALVVGDPKLPGSFAQLPGARKEAIRVDQLLRSEHLVDLLIEQPFDYILTKFFEEYKIIHIASHGVVDYESDGVKKTGILLDKIILDTAIINQRSNTPELVFINCCHLGDIDVEKENIFQSRYRLAANVGTQFINMGVKAVVVAGWAVDDKAAKVFAEVFYDKMLKGHTFGYAVKEARGQCYRQFPNTHTWGAYQCYGDQFYTMAPRSKGASEEEFAYLLPQEVIIDLEKLLDATRSSRKRKQPLLKQLEKIIEAAQISHLDDPKITELAAQAFAELGAYDQAAYAYQSLWSNDKTNWSIKSLEQYCNVKMAALWQELNKKITKKTREDIYQEMKTVINCIESLLQLGKTSERYNLMASAHKRCFLTTANKKQQEAHLNEALANYQLAREFASDTSHKHHYYALCNWMSIALFWEDERKVKAALANKAAAEYFADHLDQLAVKANNRSEFWDEIKLVNVYTILLLAEKVSRQSKKNQQKAEASLMEIEEKMRKHYLRAWKTGGSTRNRQSEIFQMTFLQQLLELTETEMTSLQPLQRQSLQRLCHFFTELT